jgi:hypothetical protein
VTPRCPNTAQRTRGHPASVWAYERLVTKTAASPTIGSATRWASAARAPDERSATNPFASVHPGERAKTADAMVGLTPARGDRESTVFPVDSQLLDRPSAEIALALTGSTNNPIRRSTLGRSRPPVSGRLARLFLLISSPVDERLAPIPNAALDALHQLRVADHRRFCPRTVLSPLRRDWGAREPRTRTSSSPAGLEVSPKLRSPCIPCQLVPRELPAVQRGLAQAFSLSPRSMHRAR